MNTLFARSALLLAAASSLAAAPAFADDMAGMKMAAPAKSQPQAQADDGLTDAVVRKVDPATGMITLKHGTLANIGMPAMTMAYKAGDAAMTQHVHAGDKVRVRVENLNGTPTIVKLDDPS
ncbi:copper-binding protein [Burkholderia sp. 3C]